MMKKPSVIAQYYFLLASILCALQECSRHWGQTASFLNRFLAFSPFTVLLIFAAVTRDTTLIASVGAVMMVTVVFTTASDKWGIYLAEKLQGCLEKIEDSASKAIQVKSGSPFVEKILLSKTNIPPVALPVALPPPRTHLAG